MIPRLIGIGVAFAIFKRLECGEGWGLGAGPGGDELRGEVYQGANEVGLVCAEEVGVLGFLPFFGGSNFILLGQFWSIVLLG